jgi:DNA-directed RNA polymerase specialized sigma24 family protein
VTLERGRGVFATTRWTTVNAARQSSESQAANALGELCEAYWPPLYGYLRRRGYRPEEAQDLTQGFFARLLETDSIRTADPARGRFRSFLLTVLKRYVINEHDRSAAARRGGGHTHLPLDFDEAERAYSLEPRTDETPDRLYLTDAGELAPYREVAARLEISEGAVKVAIHRMRQRYGAVLRSEIAETVLGEEEVEVELRELLRAVST